MAIFSVGSTIVSEVYTSNCSFLRESHPDTEFILLDAISTSTLPITTFSKTYSLGRGMGNGGVIINFLLTQRKIICLPRP